MRKTLILGCALFSLMSGTLHASEDATDEPGETTYRCWRIEKDVDGKLFEWPIAVEAHNALEAIALCATVLRERVRKANKEHRYS